MRGGMVPGFEQSLSQSGLRTGYLLSIKYPQGTVRFTDYAHDITHDGFTYLSVAGLVRVGDFTETDDLQISELVLELDAIQSAIVSLILTYDHINREVILSRVILGPEGVIIGVLILFDGLTSGASILDAAPGGSPIVQIKASSHFGDLDQKRGRFTNEESQNATFPGDEGFEFVTELAEPILWGRKDKLDGT